MQTYREHQIKREELAAFLRTHRNRIAPEDVGLPRGTRRRLPGLRREEVARLSGVGVTWYTWLEQAKNIRVSAHFLHRLSIALKLDDAERKHLFVLCEMAIPEQSHQHGIEVAENIKLMMENMAGPAYLHTLTWDLAYWNTAATAMYGDLSWVPPQELNALRLAFLDQKIRSLMVGWDPWARTIIARFRMDASAALADRRTVELIGELKDKSPEFSRWWSNREVVGRDEQPRSYLHPLAGQLDFTPTSLTVDHLPGYRLRVLTPRKPETRAKLTELIGSLGRKSGTDPRPVMAPN